MSVSALASQLGNPRAIRSRKGNKEHVLGLVLARCGDEEKMWKLYKEFDVVCDLSSSCLLDVKMSTAGLMLTVKWPQ